MLGTRTLTFVLLAAACATEKPRPDTETPLRPAPTLAPPPAADRPFDPKALMTDMVTPAECANLAKQLHAQSAERGWQMLKACIEKGKFPRASFTDWRLVLNGTWDDELSTRPDAALLLTKLIAMRGGDVEGDLDKLRSVRAPIFSLAGALKQPNVYKGRYVVLRASPDEARESADALTAKLLESSLSTAVKEAEVEGDRFGSTSSGSTSYRGRLETTRYGNYSGQAQINSSSARRDTKTRVRYENQQHPTGRVALGRLSKPDPYLEPGKDYVFLARFDGVRTSPDAPEGTPPTAVVTIVAYFVPSALLID